MLIDIGRQFLTNTNSSGLVHCDALEQGSKHYAFHQFIIFYI